MKNLDLAKARLLKCRGGRNGNPNYQKLLMSRIVHSDQPFEISVLAEEFNCGIDVMISALRNLKDYGFRFSKKAKGPNSFIYTFTGYYPELSKYKAKQKPYKKRATSSRCYW